MRHMEEGTQERKPGRTRREACWTLTSEENESREEEEEDEGEQGRGEGELVHHHCKRLSLSLDTICAQDLLTA